MKRNFIISLVLVLAVSSMAYAVPVTHSTNPHNLSNATGPGPVKALEPASGGTDEICIFCHTPHSAAPQTPLWGRPDPDTMGSFPVYAQDLVIKDNPGLSGYDINNAKYPSGASRMCLSCHDGTTSVGVLLSKTILMDGGTTLPAGVDLATSHPISFTYDANILALLTGYQLPDGLIADTPLDAAGQMQCTTCHDPHEDTQATTGLPFWRHTVGPDYYDDVCNSCHTSPTNASSPLPLPPGVHPISP